MLKKTIKSLPEKHNLTWMEMRFARLVKIKRANEKAGHSILLAEHKRRITRVSTE